MTVRVETTEHRGYRIDFTEHCGFWHPRLVPLATNLQWPTEELLVGVAAPSLEAALTKARWLIDEVLIRHPPSADRPLPKPWVPD